MKKNKNKFSIKLWLTATIVGIFCFAIFQSIVGSFLFDFIKYQYNQITNTHSNKFRFRYFIEDYKSVFSISENEYLKQNEVYDILHLIKTQDLGAVIYERGFSNPKEYLKQLKPIEKYFPLNNSNENEFIVLPNCQELINRGSLKKFGILENIALKNVDLNDLFYCKFIDKRIRCGYDLHEPFFLEELYLRPIKVLLLDIENISSAPIDKIIFEFDIFNFNDVSWKIYGNFYSLMKNMKKSCTDTFSISLLPNEHIKIPICTLFGKPPIFPKYWYLLNKKFVKSISLNNKNFDENNIINYYELKLHNNIENYYFCGPAIVPYKLKFSKGEIKIRDFKFDNLSLLTYSNKNGMVGSCPLVFVYDETLNSWTSQGEIIINAVSKQYERIDEKQLYNFSGLLKIKEIKNEISYLDWVVIKTENENGLISYFAPNIVDLAYSDEKYIILKPNEEIILDFRPLPKSKKITLIVKGFYNLL